MIGETKYVLGICEVYNQDIHGYDENSDSRVLYYYLVNTLIELENFYNNSFLENIHFLKRFYYQIDLDIIEISYLHGGEMVACKKTFWLRILQRKWKKFFKLQKEKNEKRKQLFAINYRNIYGKWPKELL